MTFAHYGGIDEVGIFVIPAVLAIVALRWIDRRTRTRAAVDEEEQASAEEEALDDPA
jgi:hypothetical protein